MKTILFSTAIYNRNRISFLYGLTPFIVEPYYITRNRRGKKVLYGRINGANEIRSFEYEKISNIKILGMQNFRL
ncbi:hypothetical protein MROS_2008 [Melioribacter roseus P3M-2]|uniref:Uncharacterized protein n=1 Tax=Melioribacter roseus (strain DSM 23840 / JCM 17771 / VKM B-2668 / P3M-2) TaxID=1191523 RepID=I6Z7U9_MELRP|nr:hypothetical protein [Melioribacter roseus]AFN75240.1 hypothetical protein MROS_2008 [Melioribacter roseus P3M-2]